ncbi:MAG: hypothetical protein A4E48_01872 [Methanosaeta sp. PtaU1.Bin060]|jgi:hypothetical protein|nr:MAG: hypothetical protein A4E48_01872 [Methanosaeta sp. PtaU1.Bin060]
MGSRALFIIFALIGCLVCGAIAGPKNQIVESQFPGENMSGSGIHQEVGAGVYTNQDDASLSFRNESLFVIRKDTGMSPNVPDKGVRTPVKIVPGLGVAPAAGSWSLTLTDVATRNLRLNLAQSGDAVFGSGELLENGTATQVTVGGTVLGDRLALFVVPTGSQNIYRLSLTLKPSGSLDGDYVFTAPGVTQPGIAFGQLAGPAVAS